MREIVVLSGKGGTGKTSLSAAFAGFASAPVICDLDVDAPDLHLLLGPDLAETYVFQAGKKAQIDPFDCANCGNCQARCRFGAISDDGETFTVVEPLCEGCGVCAHFCPVKAIRMVDKDAGRWHRSGTKLGPMLHAELFPGAENSGHLVALLRREAKKVAAETGRDLILSDGPPGIGCPVISSLTGASLAVLVAEPTPSGRHDLERISDLCGHFKIPAAVIVNKADLDAQVSADIERFCRERGHPVAARLPFSPAVVEALVRGKSMADVTDMGLDADVRGAWQAVERLAFSLPAR